MLIRNYTMRGVVELIRDWHPARMSSQYKRPKRRSTHTNGGLAYQEIVLKDKMKQCEDRIRDRSKKLSGSR